MKSIIVHDDAGFKVVATSHDHNLHPTVDIHTIHPTANHPEPHRKLQLTLPRSAFHKLADFLTKI